MPDTASKKPFKKTVILTDSACDMPLALQAETGVEIMNFGITVDGAAYTEREDFSFDEYYAMLRTCTNVPTTAHVTTPRFLQKFEELDAAGAGHVLYVSINSGGSASHDAAQLARKNFAAAHPNSQMGITIVDSHTYSMGYGWFVAEAARKLGAGAPVDEVAAWLRHTFTRVEIALAAFSLRFMKKSGRISAAAAFAGELLGLKPIISLNDGVSQVVKKVRGDKEVLPALLDHATQRRTTGEWYGVGGTDDAVVAQLAAQCEAAFGQAPACLFKLGAAVATNTGPDAVAIVFLGAPRREPDAAEA